MWPATWSIDIVDQRPVLEHAFSCPAFAVLSLEPWSLRLASLTFLITFMKPHCGWLTCSPVGQVPRFSSSLIACEYKGIMSNNRRFSIAEASRELEAGLVSETLRMN